jgi:hypothetical protein
MLGLPLPPGAGGGVGGGGGAAVLGGSAADMPQVCRDLRKFLVSILRPKP